VSGGVDNDNEEKGRNQNKAGARTGWKANDKEVSQADAGALGLWGGASGIGNGNDGNKMRLSTTNNNRRWRKGGRRGKASMADGNMKLKGRSPIHKWGAPAFTHSTFPECIITG
jgi:hypothetical protein